MIIFRNDDVSPNTDLASLEEMYLGIFSMFPDAEIWSCVTIFAKHNESGSVYPNPPFKNQPRGFFYDVDQLSAAFQFPGSKVVSHGLWHIDHSKASYELQEASILTSCKLLDTKIFVPPFNAWNPDTDLICARNDIQLIKYEEGWKSLEHNQFDSDHSLWYLHSWRYTPESLMGKLSGYCQKL